MHHLSNGLETSVANFVPKLNVQRDSVHERLPPDLELLYENEVLWHASYYATYTSTQYIKYAAASTTSVVVEDDMEEESPESSSRVLQPSIQPRDWSKCLFCKNWTYKKEKIMQNVSTIEAANTVRQSAEAKRDQDTLCLLLGINMDLVASGAKYHKTCFASYVSKSHLKSQAFLQSLCCTEWQS